MPRRVSVVLLCAHQCLFERFSLRDGGRDIGCGEATSHVGALGSAGVSAPDLCKHSPGALRKVRSESGDFVAAVR